MPPINNIPTLIAKIHAIETDETVIDKDKVTRDLIVDDFLCTGNAPGAPSQIDPVRKQQLLDAIRADYNLLGAATLNLLIDENAISLDDIRSLGIDEKFIDALVLQSQTTFSAPLELKEVGRQSTEVYFWGIPSSGKTCAIGAVMSMLSGGGAAPMVKAIYNTPQCKGYAYMTELQQLFSVSNKVVSLPKSTPVLSTYEMGFDMKDYHRCIHPLTFIDLAGELIRCMWKVSAGVTLNTDEQKAMNTLDNLLVNNRTDNRKLHFFVLEYGGGNRIYGGKAQRLYLGGALDYLKAKGILETATDGIYLLLTKADKAGLKGAALKSHLEDYIDTTEGYRGFYDGLTEICVEKHINNGEVEIIPFSLGQVCFKNYCIFNGAYTHDIIKVLVERTWSVNEWERKDTWWAKVLQGIFKSLKS